MRQAGNGVERLSADDVDWAVQVLAARGRRLVDFAPIFWRRAADADARHAIYLRHLLEAGGAVGWRVGSSVLIAAPRNHGGAAGWEVDDAAVAGDAWWNGDGVALWNAFATGHTGHRVRFVSPVYETARNRFAEAAGLAVATTWWLRELDGARPDAAGETITVAGADAVLIDAPPVYAPGGPLVFLRSVDTGADVPSTLRYALRTAEELHCAGVVVNQRAHQVGLVDAMAAVGLRAHCHFRSGVVRPVATP